MTTNEVVTIFDEQVPDEADPAKSELTDHIRLIGRAFRTMRTRVNELEAEVARQVRAAEQARAVTSAEAARRVAAEREVRRLLDVQAEYERHQASVTGVQRQLEELQGTKLVRWSAGPRRWYGAARRLTGTRP
jgi:hypothetical protein